MLILDKLSPPQLKYDLPSTEISSFPGGVYSVEPIFHSEDLPDKKGLLYGIASANSVYIFQQKVFYGLE